MWQLYLIPSATLVAAVITAAVALDRPRRRRQELLDLVQIRDAGQSAIRPAWQDVVLEKSIIFLSQTPRTNRLTRVGAALGLASAVLLSLAFVSERSTAPYFTKEQTELKVQDNINVQELAIAKQIQAVIDRDLNGPNADLSTATKEVKALKKRVDAGADALDRSLRRFDSYSASINDRIHLAIGFIISGVVLFVAFLVLARMARKARKAEVSVVRRRLGLVQTAGPPNALSPSPKRGRWLAFVVLAWWRERRKRLSK